MFQLSIKQILNILLFLNSFTNIVSFTILPTHSPKLRLYTNVQKLCMSQRNDNNMNRRDIIKKTVITTGITGVSGIIAANFKQASAYLMDEDKIIKLYEKFVPSVCYINTEYENVTNNSNNITSNSSNPFANQNPQKGLGSGFFWDKKGYIVTNFHVINKIDKATVIFTNKNNEYKEVNCKLRGVDPDKDIAVLKIDTNIQDYSCMELSTNENIKIGQYAFAIGNPFAQNNTLTMGIVSGKNRRLTAPSGKKIKNIIQTDAAINPGNSGGPLIDSSGRLIGMNTASMGLGVSCGVNFAVSVDMIKETVNNIIKYGTVKKPIFGITYLERSPSEDEAKRANISYVNKGVIVLNVPQDTPAFKGGMIGMNKKDYGDIIIGIDDYKINTVDDFIDVLDKLKPNQTVKVKTLRGNTLVPTNLEITLGEMEDSYFSKIELDK